MYQALYRKWRPRTFDDVVGQEHITETLKKQVATGRLSHAYLFIGTRGTGKTTCAKILARAVNCERPVNGNPCNECAACRGIESGGILDVVELDAASNNRVDDVRALQDEAIYSPASVKKRVYIIDEVHMLSPAAFNALLKILEEPPAHLMFILCTTELHKVLATVVSRCQRHSFKRIEADAIAGRLSYVAAQEGIGLTPDAAALLARMADGGLRDALSLLDQCSAREQIDIDAVRDALGLAGSERIAALLQAICDRAPDRALSIFDALWKDGKDPAGILEELSDLMRDILLLQVAPRGCGALLSGVYDMETLGRFAAAQSSADLMDGMAAIRGADLSGQSPRRAAEMCLVRLCVPETGDSIAALKGRISRLEAALRGGVPLPAAPAVQAAPETPTPPPQSAPAPQPVQPAPAPEPEIPAPQPESAVPDDEPPWFTDEDAPPEDADFLPPAPFEPAPAPAASEPTLEPELVPAPQPEPKPESEPEPEPEPAPAPPAPQAAAASDGGADTWDALVKRLNGKLDMGTYAMVSTPTQASGRLAGDVMTVFVATPIAKLLLDTPETVTLFQHELRDMLGRSVRVIFTDEEDIEPNAPDMAKLESLKRFPNFKIE